MRARTHLFKTKHIPKIHGHRGARGLCPENTLNAFATAVDLGCEAVEMDVWVSADDQLIVHHDPSLCPSIARTSDGLWIEEKLLIRQLSRQELANYDVGRMNPHSNYADKFPDQVPCDGQRIPTLAEVIHEVHKLNACIEINIELKSNPAHASHMPNVERYIDIVIRELTELKIIDKALVQSFDWRLPLAVKLQLPDLKIGLLSDQHGWFGIPKDLQGRDLNQRLAQPSLSLNQLPNLVHQLGADTWSPNFVDIHHEVLAEAHRLGLEVCVWTVNQEQHFEAMLELGVDAITTDYPDRLSKFLKRD